MAVSDNIALARERRLLQFEAAKFIAPLVGEGGNHSSLTWAALSELPDWCRWPKPELNRLILVAGALFSLPSIRLWIDAKKIREARMLIGDKTFELVMANKSVPQKCTQAASNKSVEQLFFCSGAAVLLSSADEELQPYIKTMLPAVAGKLPFDIAALLMSEALNTLTTINHMVSDDYTDNREKLSESEEGTL